MHWTASYDERTAKWVLQFTPPVQKGRLECGKKLTEQLMEDKQLVRTFKDK